MSGWKGEGVTCRMVSSMGAAVQVSRSAISSAVALG